MVGKKYCCGRKEKWKKGKVDVGGRRLFAGFPQEAAINTSVSAQSSWKMFVLVTDYK